MKTASELANDFILKSRLRNGKTTVGDAIADANDLERLLKMVYNKGGEKALEDWLVPHEYPLDLEFRIPSPVTPPPAEQKRKRGEKSKILKKLFKACTDSDCKYFVAHTTEKGTYIFEFYDEEKALSHVKNLDPSVFEIWTRNEIVTSWHTK